MKLDPTKYYQMPLAMGPMLDRKALKLAYPQQEVVAFQYLTDSEALADLLPDCYRPGKDPVVTISFSQYNSLSFIPGGGYRSASVRVSARFDGGRDHFDGDYIVAMFEDNTSSVITGREGLGFAKIYADISNLKTMPDGHLRCEASLVGHLLFGLDIPPLKSQIGVVRVLESRQINAKPWLGYKYIPSLDGSADAEYPTMVHYISRLEKLWLGKKASLRFGMARGEDIGVVKNLLDALATLTIIHPIQAMHFTGSAVMRYDLARRLR